MFSSLQKALLGGAVLAALLGASPAIGKDVYKGFLDPSIPHHAAILDTLSKIEQNPADGALQNDLGCLVAWDGFWRDALRSFDLAAELAPKDSRPPFNAGLVQALRGDWGAARSRFHKAVKVDPGNWAAWWMLGFAEETLGNEGAAIDAYSRSLRVDTSLFDPRVNPFAVASHLRAQALLATYERRRVDAALPFSNQLADSSRVASFFQHGAKASQAVVEIEEPPRTGPVVTSVPSPSTVRPPATTTTQPPAAEQVPRRRRMYTGRSGSEGAAIEVSPAPARDAAPPQDPASLPPAEPGPGAGAGGPGMAVPPPAPAPGAPVRAPAAPGPGGPPDEE